MAFTTDQQTRFRHWLADQVQDTGPVRWTKGEAHAALQAIDDLVESNRAAINNAIESAAPGVFTADEKLLLIKAWAVLKGRV